MTLPTEKETVQKAEFRTSLTDEVSPSPSGDYDDVVKKPGNPLTALSREQLVADGEAFAKAHNLGHLSDLFQKAALVAQDPSAFETIPLLTEEEKESLRRELSHKWDQPKMLYYLVVLCSLAAAVQGMDESVINGANLFFAPQFGIDPSTGDTGRNQWLLGLVNSAPYVCVTNSWQHLFVARFVLGLGIGPKSSTVPVYAAECAPPAIRGALVMMWQMWTAFGIMMGFVADIAFFKVPDKPHITGLNWRLMLASAGVPALVIITQVFFCPESPRWYITKGHYDKAYESLLRLRNAPIQAARDLYYMHVLIEAERDVQKGRSRFLELFTVPRNRRATLASFIVMFMQQFCGVNAIAYYSSNIFRQANFSQIQSLLASFGFGAVNFVFAIPAFYTIDTFGRRNLLLVTFPLMSLFLLMTGFAFWIPADSKARLAVVALGIYLYGTVYSPGEGPLTLDFQYSAEAFPLHVRDTVFSVPTHRHASYQMKALPHNIKKYIFRRRVTDLAPLYDHERTTSNDISVEDA
ncbi:hypothetical protein H0H92_008543 [Tricholoma furcatifolium]|nr:hypothetical protein H0H92_008543 [Tricholoma furcatifolium]